MAVKTETKQIGENEFTVTQWSAEKAFLNKLKLAKIFGASLSKLIEFESKDKSQALSEALNDLFSNSDEDVIFNVIKDCIYGVGCNGEKLSASNFNIIFTTDNLLDIYKVFAFVLQVNYANLFKGWNLEEVLAKTLK